MPTVETPIDASACGCCPAPTECCTLPDSFCLRLDIPCLFGSPFDVAMALQFGGGTDAIYGGTLSHTRTLCQYVFSRLQCVEGTLYVVDLLFVTVASAWPAPDAHANCWIDPTVT